LRDKSAATVAKALLHSVYLKHGLYHFVQSDLGKEFECEVQNELNAYFGISKLRTTAFKPSSNPIERGHRTLNAMIGKLIDKHKEWSQYMDYIALAYNSTCHKSTSFTPNFLHFGRELNSSVDVLLANPSDNVGSSGEFVAKMVDGLAVAYQLARETLQETAVQASRYYNKKVKEQNFRPGDKILAYYPRRYKNRYPKWQRFYCLECVVTKRLNDVTYIVTDIHTRKQRVLHVDKIKLLERSQSVDTTAATV